MKTIVVLAALLACCETALGQAAECRTITDPGQRLACYDKLSPPAATPAATAAAIAGKKDFVDPTKTDDKMLDTRLKGICRGC